MTRTEVAKELSVFPWDVDDWLLWGCPARKIRTEWDFDIWEVKRWLQAEKIKVGVPLENPPQTPIFDPRWFGGRCPVCADRGFPGEKAGKLYTYGEILQGHWHLRRTGVPCGHSSVV